jgi:hypothetical protein
MTPTCATFPNEKIIPKKRSGKTSEESHTAALGRGFFFHTCGIFREKRIQKPPGQNLQTQQGLPVEEQRKNPRARVTAGDGSAEFCSHGDQLVQSFPPAKSPGSRHHEQLFAVEAPVLDSLEKSCDWCSVASTNGTHCQSKRTTRGGVPFNRKRLVRLRRTRSLLAWRPV